MFLITLLAALITIIPWTKRFWNDFLSKSVTQPIYVHLIILFVVVALAIKIWPATPATEDRPKELKIIKGESFGTQRVYVDEKHFENCIFDGTEFVFRGEASVALVYCTFKKPPKITFDGPAAATMNTLTNMYATPEFRPKIEATFEAIKAGKFTIATPPSDAADD